MKSKVCVLDWQVLIKCQWFMHHMFPTLINSYMALYAVEVHACNQIYFNGKNNVDKKNKLVI